MILILILINLTLFQVISLNMKFKKSYLLDGQIQIKHYSEAEVSILFFL